MTILDVITSIVSLARQFSVQIIIALIAFSLLWNKFQAGLVKIPGPTAAAYTRLWRAYNVLKGRAHLDAISLHKKYGNLVRIGPKHVSIADPKWIPIIYDAKQEYLKTAFYPIQSITWERREAVNLFSTRDPEWHRQQRRKIGHVYSVPDLLQSESLIDSCTDLLLQRLDSLISHKPTVDLGGWLRYYAFDVIGEITFGEKMGFLKKGADVDGIMGSVAVLLPYSAIIGQIPILHRFLLANPILARLMPPMEAWSPPVLIALKALDDHKGATKHYEKARSALDTAAANERSDMLSRWMAVDDSSPYKMDTREMVIHIGANMFAGADTTSIALRAVFYYLCKTPDCMTRLVKEIDQANAAGKLSTPIAYKQTTELPYLSAVVKESMRMHPSLGLMLERHVPREGVEIDGHFLKGGTIVGMSPWVTSRNAEVFPDPERFNPERWLDASEDQLKAMENLWEFNFGAGARKCIGRNVSWIEISKIVPELLRRYHIKLTHPEKEWKVLNTWFTPQKGVICDLTRRS